METMTGLTNPMLSLPLDMFDMIALHVDTATMTNLMSVLDTSSTMQPFKHYLDDSNVSFWRRYFARQFPCLYHHLKKVLKSSNESRGEIEFRDWKRALFRRQDLGLVWESVAMTVAKEMMLNEELDDEQLILHFNQAGGETSLASSVDNLLKEHALLDRLEITKDLSTKFYCSRMLDSFNTFENILPKLADLPWDDEQALIDVAEIMIDFALLFKPLQNRHAFRQRISEKLGQIEQMVKDELGQNKAFVPSKFNPDLKSAQQVLKALNTVLFEKIGFRGATADSYYRCNNSFIDDVLESKVGIPISLCLIYKHLASKFSIDLRTTNVPYHFVLRWDHAELQQPLFIDCFNRGEQQKMSELNIPAQFRSEEACSPVSLKPVVQRMARNVMRCLEQPHMPYQAFEVVRKELKSFELLVAVEPLDYESLFHLFGQYTRLEINLNRVLKTIDRAKETISRRGLEESPMLSKWSLMQEAFIENKTARDASEADKRNEAKLRSTLSAVHGSNKGFYAVGLIFRHKRYAYKAVIYQWDPFCTASEAWIHQMGVHNLPDGPGQPFYNVLVSDGSKRYVAEENIEPMVSEFHMIEHEDIGKYFCAHAGTHYVANKCLKQLYPEDEHVLQQLLHKGS